MPSRSLHVAVIGAGAAGLVAARELRREGHAPVVFERAAAVGGTWLYDDGVPTDDPLGAGGTHSSLYASLRTNIPRECMGFFDFPFIAEESAGDPRRYPGHEEVLRYLQEFARRFDLNGLVRLETEVLRVRRDDASAASWRVSYRSTKLPGTTAGSEQPEEEEAFDAAVVCNGHFTEPRLADITGIDGWPGKQIHSHSYRVPDPFQGQVVVIIGYHPSGMDISRDIAGVAKEVHVAIRSEPPCEMQSTTAHANLWLHSMVERAEKDGSVVFQDGSRVKTDVILHCTGYKYSFPFLGDDDETFGIHVDDNRVGPLYKHVFPPHLAPQISFIGLPFKGIPFPLFQLQSNWVAGVLSGRIELPSQKEMMHDVASFYLDMEARGCPKRYTHGLELTLEYEDWLVEKCGMENIEEWRKVIHLAARAKVSYHPESYRDEWDDDHLVTQAHHDFTKYL
uniref:Uncharacterized protein n=1 Tax=Avena sativa TaxID=4498 RepID=A0ACD5WIL9_AVESA